ncbi:hypothetical protein GCM10018952_62570 [Streptosporangium vulgare]
MENSVAPIPATAVLPEKETTVMSAFLCSCVCPCSRLLAAARERSAGGEGEPDGARDVVAEADPATDLDGELAVLAGDHAAGEGQPVARVRGTPSLTLMPRMIASGPAQSVT